MLCLLTTENIISSVNKSEIKSLTLIVKQMLVCGYERECIGPCFKILSIVCVCACSQSLTSSDIQRIRKSNACAHSFSNACASCGLCLQHFHFANLVIYEVRNFSACVSARFSIPFKRVTK